MTVDDEYRQRCVDALDARDWHGAYQWAKGWIGQGGAGLLDPWLVYVASAVERGQPRIATHSVDLALEAWFATAPERAVLRFIRSRVVWLRLRDPKTALADLKGAQVAVPLWLAAIVSEDIEPMTRAAASSRKRKPSVAAAPEYRGPTERMTALAERRLPAGSRPELWEVLARRLDLGQL